MNNTHKNEKIKIHHHNTLLLLLINKFLLLFSFIPRLTIVVKKNHNEAMTNDTPSLRCQRGYAR